MTGHLWEEKQIRTECQGNCVCPTVMCDLGFREHISGDLRDKDGRNMYILEKELLNQIDSVDKAIKEISKDL